jgi:hypothetical protein
MLVNKGKIEVEIDNLNVRNNPNLNAVVVETCKQGVYDVLDRKNGFIKIGDNKWVKAEYTKAIKETVVPEKKVEEKPLFEDKKIEVGEE